MTSEGDLYAKLVNPKVLLLATRCFHIPVLLKWCPSGSNSDELRGILCRV